MIPKAWTDSLTPAKALKRLGGVWFLGCSLIVWREGDFSRPLTGSSIPLLAVLGGLVLVFVLFTLLDHRFPRMRARRLSAGVRRTVLWVDAGMALCGKLPLVLLRGGARGAVFGAGAAVPAEGLAAAAAAVRAEMVSGGLCGMRRAVYRGGGHIGCLRYLGYLAPNFDFGVFTQMFHNMRESFLPMTTCERNGLLSHFAVHISPVFYLLLPFYALFPSPADPADRAGGGAGERSGAVVFSGP